MTSYGYQLAAKKRKERESKQSIPKRPISQSKQPSQMNCYPMDNYDGPSHDINWGINQSISTTLTSYVKDNLFSILCLPAGVGKTAIAVETLGLLQHELGVELPFIVIAPRAVQQQGGWHKTIASWNMSNPNNQLRPYMLETPERFANLLDHNKTLVEITKSLGKHGIVVIDECHYYKNIMSKRSKTLRKLKDVHKLGLSATPLTNDVVMDSMSYLIHNGKYKNKTQFMKTSGLEFAPKDQFHRLLIYTNDGKVNTSVFPYYPVMKKQLSSLIYAPTIDMSTIDIPELTSKLIQLDNDPELSANMRSLSWALRDKAFDSQIDYLMAVIETLSASSVRLRACSDIVLQDNVIQPLIFYWHTSTLDILMKHFDTLNIPYQIISGQHPVEDVDFSSPHPIFVQYQAGAEGIEMKTSNTTIYYQNQGSYSKFEQAQGRNVRRGTSHNVTHYTLLSDQQFDITIFERLRQREELSTEMIAEIAVMCSE